MSTFNVFGFFALAAASALQLMWLKLIPLQQYTFILEPVMLHFQTIPYIAFIVAKAFAPTGKPVELDVLYMYTIPGDPNDDEYEKPTMTALQGLKLTDYRIREYCTLHGI
ncbi:hypothetical protein B0H13DRAFT_2372418 [Mycena leptocephala]|nr:hypothetical protein B0H13DRAFT_2372418 [Mycena leptocephala]